MKNILFISACFLNISLCAQKTVDVSSGYQSALSPSFFNVVGGEPFVSTKFTKLVDGTPYFRDEWMKGTVLFDQHSQYGGVYLKLDLYNNAVHYLDAKNNEMIASSKIQKVLLFDSTTQELFSFINGEYIQASGGVTGWYQILAEGNTSLFKHIDKKLREDRPYGSATVEQSIFSSNHYYVLNKGVFKEVKKFKGLPDFFQEKKDLITTFIKNKNLSGKTDADFVSVINYVNGLN